MCTLYHVLYTENTNNFDGNFELGLLSDHILSYIASVD